MLSLHWKTAGAALALGLVTFAAAPAAVALSARAPSRSWHLVYRAPAGPEIQGIAAPSKTAGWAFAAIYASNHDLRGFFYLHWNGVSWRRTRIPVAAGFTPEQIQASSVGNVWMFGYRTADLTGEALVYNGHSWKAMAAPRSDEPLAPAVVASRSDVWLVYQSGCVSPGCTTVVENWNGTGWNSYQLPAQLQLAGGGTHPWLVGVQHASSTRREAVYRWNGSNWRAVTAPGKAAARVVGVGSPGGRLWLSTERRAHGPWSLFDRVGSAWSKQLTPRSFNPTSGPGFPVFDGHNGFWSLPFHWTGTRWIRTMPKGPREPWWFNTFWYNEVAPVPGSFDVWAAILANTSRTSGTQQFAIGAYGKTP